MKRLLGIIATLCILFSLSTSVFADRVLLIPDLPKTPYRGGIERMKEWLPTVRQHQKRQPLIFNVMKLAHGEMHSFITQWIGMKVFRLHPQSILPMVQAPAANKRFVHVELCETADYAKFKRSYEKYVKLLAKILKDNNLSVEKDCGHITM